MSKRIRLTSTVLTLLFVLLFSAVHPLTAYADSGTPVATDPPATATDASTSAPATDTAATTGAPATQACAATDAAPATPVPPSSTTTTDPSSESTNPTATATTSPDLSQVPTGTSVVVVNK